MRIQARCSDGHQCHFTRLKGGTDREARFVSVAEAVGHWRVDAAPTTGCPAGPAPDPSPDPPSRGGPGYRRHRVLGEEVLAGRKKSEIDDRAEAMLTQVVVRESERHW